MNLVGIQKDGIGFLREIARGARSKVYLVAYEQQLYAAKLFLPKYADFAEQEYRFGHNLNHPNINAITKLIEIEGLKGVLMPFLEGQKLSDYYDLAIEDFLPLFVQVLDAIAYLHKQEVIHRDIKPENVVVAEHKVKLLDFDLASTSSDTYKTTALAGTIAYLSPEEAQGKAASSSSDLYAAAVILYRALTGEVPFTGSIKEVMLAHKQQLPRSPSSIKPSLAPYDELMAKALAKQPEERFANAEAFKEAINTLEFHSSAQ